MPAKFNYKGETLTKKEDISNGFNDYFSSIGKEMADTLLTTPGFEEYLTQTTKCFSLEPLEIDKVEEISRKQQPKLSCGLDMINNKIVKTACMQLATPVSIIVNKSIREATVPRIYKKAKIVPLYKKGPTNECKLTPISFKNIGKGHM